MMSNANRRRHGLVALGCAFTVTLTAGSGGNGQKFYPDDPIARIVDAEDAAGVHEREIDLAYDTLENLFSWPGDQTPNVRAQNVNTIDEVPDSTWFTNRLGTVPVTVDELVTSPGSGADELTIDEQARITPPSGSRRQFKQSDIQSLLRSAHRESDGSYRVVASKALEGRPVGGFRFYGTR